MRHERKRFEESEKHQRVFARDGYTCCFPGCGKPARHLAHRIANTKTNRKIYGDMVIDHDENVRSVCDDPTHNDYYNIGNQPAQAQKLAKKILEGNYGEE